MSEISAKAIFLGDASVGKSSLIKRYFEDDFDDHIPNTIGTAFLTKTFENDQKNRLVKLNVWDTCGQERFMAIASIYYRDANIIILVIDCESEKSLEMAEKYLWEIKNNAIGNPFIVLVVNKIDLLPKFSKYVELGPELYMSCQFYDKIIKFMEANSLEHVFWTSAKEEGINVKGLFNFLGNSILNGDIHIESDAKGNRKKILAHSVLKSQPKLRNNNSSCC
jgi:small GTP-binding protein